jgi:hypothetical protein
MLLRAGHERLAGLEHGLGCVSLGTAQSPEAAIGRCLGSLAGGLERSDGRSIAGDGVGQASLSLECQPAARLQKGTLPAPGPRAGQRQLEPHQRLFAALHPHRAQGGQARGLPGRIPHPAAQVGAEFEGGEGLVQLPSVPQAERQKSGERGLEPLVAKLLEELAGPSKVGFRLLNSAAVSFLGPEAGEHQGLGPGVRSFSRCAQGSLQVCGGLRPLTGEERRALSDQRPSQGGLSHTWGDPRASPGTRSPRSCLQQRAKLRGRRARWAWAGTETG